MSKVLLDIFPGEIKEISKTGVKRLQQGQNLCAWRDREAQLQNTHTNTTLRNYTFLNIKNEFS